MIGRVGESRYSVAVTDLVISLINIDRPQTGVYLVCLGYWYWWRLMDERRAQLIYNDNRNHKDGDKAL